MAGERLSQLPVNETDAPDLIYGILDGESMAFPPSNVDVEIPYATEAQAIAGTRGDLVMSPLTTSAVMSSTLESYVPADNISTRDEFVVRNLDLEFQAYQDGQSVVAEGLTYIRFATSTTVQDLPGWIPAGDWHLGHFADVQPDCTTAFRLAIDAAIRSLQAGSWGRTLIIPEGTLTATDELMSDWAQEQWWLQTNLGKGKRICLVGAGKTATTIQVGSGWLSGVRNAANGNQRAYGPWAGQPSPAFLLPFIANKAARTPGAVDISNLTIRGRKLPGSDPIGIGHVNLLDATTKDLAIQNFGNHSHLLMGAYNNVFTNLQHEGNGAQPVESGAVLGNPAGFPPPWVRFNVTVSAGVLTLSAVASAAYQGYAVGDPVPYFKSADVGKQIMIHNGASHGGTAQALKCVVASYISPTQITATRVNTIVTIAGGISPGQTTASFMPVKATTVAGSPVVNLSAPIKCGPRG